MKHGDGDEPARRFWDRLNELAREVEEGREEASTDLEALERRISRVEVALAELLWRLTRDDDEP